MKTSRAALAPALMTVAICAHLLAGVALAQSPSTHQHSFTGAEHWAHVFDDPARDAWQQPHAVIRALALAPDAVVADVGAGTGYFAMRLANMLPKGRVYGVDIEPEMVNYLTERARRESLANVVSRLGKSDDPGLPESVDLILLVDVYHHIEDRVRYFRRLQSSLKPHGRVAIIDFRLDSPAGPPRAARIAKERVLDELAQAGYAVESTHDFLPRQYFVIFKPVR